MVSIAPGFHGRMRQHGRGGLWGPASLVDRGSSGAGSGGEGRSPSAGVHRGFTGRHDWTRLLGGRFGAEVGWLYPLALVLGLTWRRGTPRADRVRGGFVMWGAWLLTFGIIFSG